MEQNTKLFTCPECGEVITDTQKDCPKCGFPAAKLQEAKAAAIQKEERIKREMEATKAAQLSVKTESSSAYDVDSRAERILDNIAKAYLICGWIFGVIFFLVGIFAGVAIGLEEGGFLGIIAGILLGVLSVLLGYVAWALLKVIVNISNNLYNINFILNKK